jgi:hypothetical protein
VVEEDAEEDTAVEDVAVVVEEEEVTVEVRLSLSYHPSSHLLSAGNRPRALFLSLPGGGYGGGGGGGYGGGTFT